MAKKPGKRPQSMKARAAKTAAVVSPASALAAEAAPKKPPFNPLQFAQEVRLEGRKITWPAWKETWITSVMVFIMVALAAVFFWIVDFSLSWLLGIVLNLGQ